MKNVNVLKLSLDNGLTVTTVDLDNTTLCKDLQISQKPIPPTRYEDEAPRKPSPPRVLTFQLLEEERKLIINGVSIEGAVLDILANFLQQ